MCWGGLCDFRRLVVSRVVGTGLNIAGGDCVSGLEGSFGGLRVVLSCGVGRGHLGVLGWWPLALGRVAGPLWHGWWCWAWALVFGRCLTPRGEPRLCLGVWVALGMPQYGWVGAGPGAGLVDCGSVHLYTDC